MGKGFIYDMSKCIGCKTCQTACQEKNALAVGEYFRRVDTISNGEAGTPRWAVYSGACNHCEDPACVSICPTGAIYKDRDGIVLHDNSRCIGCGRCVSACPYGAVSINAVSGYAQKCDACRSLRSEGKDPVCVSACPTRALTFGSIDDCAGVKGNLRFLPSTKETRPNVCICGVPTALVKGEADKNVPECGNQETPFFKNTDEVFAVFGGGPAAVSAAEAIRSRNKTARIVLVSRERQFPYCRPLISKAKYHGFLHSAYSMVDEKWIEDKHIEVMTNTELVSLDIEKRIAKLSNGEELAFDKCVYALGADCTLPPLAGVHLPGVYSVRTISDVEELRRAQLLAKRAVVVGGGVIGLESAWRMKELGIDVCVVELGATLMGRLCDEKTALLLKQALEEKGISVLTGVGLKTINGVDHVSSVKLSNGTVLDTQLLVLSIGIVPNSSVAAHEGVEASRAIIVDENMLSSCDFLWACGDSAVFHGVNNGTWIQGIAQGTVAGANAAGEKLSYEQKPSSIVLHAADTMLYTIGDMGKDVPGEKYQLLSCTIPSPAEFFLVNPQKKPLAKTHISLCFLAGRLVGAAAIGELKCIRTIQRGVEHHEEQETILKELKALGVEFE